MILACDVAPARSQVKGGDVVRAVAVLELDGTRARRQREQLVAQADAHDRHRRLVHQPAQVVHGGLAVRRVAGPVGDEDAVVVPHHLVDGVVVREHGGVRAAADQAAQDVLLDAAVDNGNMRATLRVRRRDVEGRLGADLAHQVDLLRVHEGLVLVRVVLLADRDARERGALLAQVRHDGARVDARHGGHALARAPLAERLDGRPVRVLEGRVGHDDAAGLDVRRLEVLEQAKVVARRRRHAVVADQRLREDEDLAPVRRVRQRLRVADERGGEDGFAGDVGLGAEGLAIEDRPVLQRVSAENNRQRAGCVLGL